MLPNESAAVVHPLGESILEQRPWPVDTPGGRYWAEFDEEAPVTREGQLIFFAQFLHTGGRWKQFVDKSPLTYQGNRGSQVVDVLGTAALSILCGHWRYAHINAVRGDQLNPPLLGMSGTVSEDVVRGAWRRMDEATGLTWLGGELRDCVEPVLSQPWIMDIDVTIKTIYGRQQGADIGHNPHKPGRPSHAYHSYFMANTRLCLGVEVLSGKEHAARHALPGLWSLLDELPRTHWPSMLRGDCGYGNEVLLSAAEERGLPCLFKLRHTAKVKALINRALRAGGVWEDAGDGWEVMTASLRLSGWTRERHVVLVREAPGLAPVGAQARRRRDYLDGSLPGSEQWPPSHAPWSGRIAVLVTTLDAVAYPAIVLARLYRERADAENIYDELKNQWGWNGFTTKKLKPCRFMANLVALIYNWWHLYARMHDGAHHREAITSRPALLGGVGRLTQHGGKSTVKVSLLHENREAIVHSIAHVSNTLDRFHAITERWTIKQRWALLLTHIFRHWLGGKWLGQLPNDAHLILSA
jgi:hypothetical protein